MNAAELAQKMKAFPGQWSSGRLLADPHRQLERVLEVWHAAAAGRALPSYRALGAVQLKAVLPDVHIYDVRSAPPRYVVRLIGTRMTEQLGSGMTGRPVADFPVERLRDAIAGLLGVVEASRAPLHLKAPRAVALPNGEHRSLESLWLPCGEDGQTVDRIIAVSLLGEDAL